MEYHILAYITDMYSLCANYCYLLASTLTVLVFAGTSKSGRLIDISYELNALFSTLPMQRNYNIRSNQVMIAIFATRYSTNSIPPKISVQSS